MTIKNPLAERIFQCGTGVLFDSSINIQAVGGVWHGCTCTPRERAVFRKRFKAVGGGRLLNADLHVQAL